MILSNRTAMQRTHLRRVTCLDVSWYFHQHPLKFTDSGKEGLTACLVRLPCYDRLYIWLQSHRFDMLITILLCLNVALQKEFGHSWLQGGFEHMAQFMGPIQHLRASVQVFNLHYVLLVFLYRSRVIVFDVVGFRFCGWDSSCNTLDLGLEFSLVSFRPGAGKTVGGCLHGTREYNEIDHDRPCGSRRWPGHNGSRGLAPNSWVFAGIH